MANQGQGAAPDANYWYGMLYLPTNATWDQNDTRLEPYGDDAAYLDRVRLRGARDRLPKG